MSAVAENEIKAAAPAAPPISVTPRAAEEVRRIVDEQRAAGVLGPDERVYLRVSVKGGGCSGFQYGLRLEETKQEDDAELEIEGVKVLVDPMSYTMLGGVTVDFIDSLTHTGF